MFKILSHFPSRFFFADLPPSLRLSNLFDASLALINLWVFDIVIMVVGLQVSLIILFSLQKEQGHKSTKLTTSKYEEERQQLEQQECLAEQESKVRMNLE